MNVQSRKDLPGISQSVRTFCKRSWWAFLIGGIASVILGLIALAAPQLALLGLALYFAASVLVDGAVNVVGALSNRSRDGFWFMLVFGVLALIAGAYALVNPPVSVLAMVALSAFVAISLGSCWCCLAIGSGRSPSANGSSIWWASCPSCLVPRCCSIRRPVGCH